MYDELFYKEPLDEYEDFELMHALNSWLLDQAPVHQYHPGHKYDGPVMIEPSTYAFYMGMFASELSSRGIMPTSVSDIDLPCDIQFIEGTYPMYKDDDGKIIIFMGPDNKLPAPAALYLIQNK